MLLVIDQFEELFTQCKDDYRQDFLGLINHLVTLPHFRLLVTLRADFYPRAIEEPSLAYLLRQDRGTFPLDPPSIAAILQMIIRPAEAAGVELQEGLAQRLQDEAGSGPGAMAIIAFTLSQLYEQTQPAQVISIKAYDAFGGVKGAIQKRAEAAFQGLKIDLDKVLPQLFSLLVEVNEQEVATRRRTPQAQLQGDVKTLAERLIAARLLVGSGDKNVSMIEVAHETVLTGWDRLNKWILDHAVALRMRRDLEQAANEWLKSQRPGSALRTGALLKNYLHAAEPRSDIAKDYLAVCTSRRNWFRGGYAVLGVLLLAGSGIWFHVKDTKYPPTFATYALWVQLGIKSVPLPKMVRIPEGSFQMGDLSGQSGQSDEQPVHTIRFSKPFEMAQYEVTFAGYDLFAAATGREKPDDSGWGRGDKPVISVSWNDAVDYAKWLSERTGLKYRLPSEAEWEYAARATTTTERYWPEKTENEKDDPACQYVNIYDRQNEARINQSYNITWETFACNDAFPFTASTAESAKKLIPNKWQLFNMLGNVWEWTQDCYDDSYKDTPRDGSAQGSADNLECLRVLRGGSWGNEPRSVRSATRSRNTPDNRNSNIGFRLARTL